MSVPQLLIILKQTVDIGNHSQLNVADKPNRKVFECFDCKSNLFIPFQSECGRLMCSQCSHKCCDNMICQKRYDVRVENNNHALCLKCHFHDQGCKWIGNIPSYYTHMLYDCENAKWKCHVCFQLVHWKHEISHLTKHNEKKKRIFANVFGTSNVKCPKECGHNGQGWTMKVHMFDECSNSTLQCVLGSKCEFVCEKHKFDEHHRKCVSLHTNQICDILSNTFQEKLSVTFELKTTDDIHSFNDNACFMFRNKQRLRLNVNAVSNPGFLSVGIENIETDYDVSWHHNAIWKNATAIATMTNRTMTSEPKHYTRPLPFKTFQLSNYMFKDSEYILIANLKRNAITNTCYFKDNKLSFVVTLFYSNTDIKSVIKPNPLFSNTDRFHFIE